MTFPDCSEMLARRTPVRLAPSHLPDQCSGIRRRMLPGIVAGLVALSLSASALAFDPFTVRDIRWLIELTKEGRLGGILPLGDEKSGAERWGCPEMHDMNSGGKAHFLIDNLKTALLLKAAASDKPRHDFYVARIRDAAIDSPMLNTIATFLDNAVAMDSLRRLSAGWASKPTACLP